MVKSILLLIASIGVMLVGVKTLSDSLQKLVNDKIRKNINGFAKNRVKTAVTGTVVTFAMQSSTASTIMTAGLTAVGILSLLQAMSFVIGCNIGSALTGTLLIFNSFSVKEVFAVLCFIGAILSFFKNDKIKLIGKALIGFGLLFAGLSFIGINIDQINTQFDISTLFTSVNFPLALLLIGIIVTMIMQSSFGTLALLITLVTSSAMTNGLTLFSLSYILYGINIGTTFTTLFVSLTSNKDGKRLALFHLFFNICGAVLFSLLNLTGFLNVLELITSDVALQLILLDIIFNFVTAVLMLILINPLSKLFSKLFKSKKTDENKYLLDTAVLSVPVVAINQLNNQLLLLFEETKGVFNSTKEYVYNDVYFSKKLKENFIKVDASADKIYQNCLLVTGDLTEHDKENLSFIQFSIRMIKKCISICEKISGLIIIDKEKIKLYEKQKTIINSITENQDVIFEKLTNILSQITNENKEYDYKSQIIEIFKCVEVNSLTKSKQKLEYISEYHNKTEKKHYVFFMLLNHLQDMTNYLSDLSLEAFDFVNNIYLVNEKGENNEK